MEGGSGRCGGGNEQKSGESIRKKGDEAADKLDERYQQFRGSCVVSGQKSGGEMERRRDGTGGHTREPSSRRVARVLSEADRSSRVGWGKMGIVVFLMPVIEICTVRILWPFLPYLLW